MSQSVEAISGLADQHVSLTFSHRGIATDFICMQATSQLILWIAQQRASDKDFKIKTNDQRIAVMMAKWRTDYILSGGTVIGKTGSVRRQQVKVNRNQSLRPNQRPQLPLRRHQLLLPKIRRRKRRKARSRQKKKKKVHKATTGDAAAIVAVTAAVAVANDAVKAVEGVTDKKALVVADPVFRRMWSILLV